MKYIYMLRSGEDHYKVGISSDVLKRIKTIQTSNQHPIRLVILRMGSDALSMERELHEWLNDYRTDGGTEWFKLDGLQALDLVMKITNWDSSDDITSFLTLQELGRKQGILERRVERLEQKGREGMVGTKQLNYEDEDELLEDALELVTNSGSASASFLQRRLRVGYARASRLLDTLEERKIVSPLDGAHPREVLITRT